VQGRCRKVDASESRYDLASHLSSAWPVSRKKQRGPMHRGLLLIRLRFHERLGNQAGSRPPGEGSRIKSLAAPPPGRSLSSSSDVSPNLLRLDKL